MYVDDGSCDPKGLLIGGPPGIPGNPCPADFNEPGRLELGMELIPGALVTIVPGPPAVGVAAEEEVSTPACGFCKEGLCRFDGVVDVCAKQGATRRLAVHAATHTIKRVNSHARSVCLRSRGIIREKPRIC